MRGKLGGHAQVADVEAFACDDGHAGDAPAADRIVDRLFAVLAGRIDRQEQGDFLPAALAQIGDRRDQIFVRRHESAEEITVRRDGNAWRKAPFDRAVDRERRDRAARSHLARAEDDRRMLR